MSDVDDLEKRYEPMIRQIAELFPERESSSAFLLGLKAKREDWEVGGAGGRVYLEESWEPTHVDLIGLIADDLDGAIIEISLNIIGSRTNWIEWYRLDGQPVLRWPPPSVLPKSRLLSRRPGRPEV